MPENPFAEDDEFRVPGVWTPDEAAAGPQYVTVKQFAQYVAAMNQHGVMAVNSTEDAPHPEQKVRSLGFGGGSGNLDPNGIQLVDDGTVFRAYRVVPDVYTDAPSTTYPHADFGASVSSNATPNALAAQLWTDASTLIRFYAQTDGGSNNGERIIMDYDGTAEFGWYADDGGAGPLWSFKTGGGLGLFVTASDPSYLQDGLIWYRSDTDKFRVRLNGATYNLAIEGGPNVLAYAAETSDYTTTANDHFLTFDASGAARTCTLVTAVGNAGLRYVIKKIDTSVNLVTIDGNGSQTIDGALTTALSRPNESICIFSNGANWLVESRY